MNEDSFHLGIKALIRNDKGEVLLLQVNPAVMKGRDYWDLPGGRVQRGQTIEDTLRREVEEETGIRDIADIQDIGMVLSNIRIPVGDTDLGLILGVFSISTPAGAAIEISEEHQAYEWFSPARAAELLEVKYPAHFCELIANLPPVLQ